VQGDLRTIENMAAPGIGQGAGTDQVDRALPAMLDSNLSLSVEIILHLGTSNIGVVNFDTSSHLAHSCTFTNATSASSLFC
jgi:hypothetical protein